MGKTLWSGRERVLSIYGICEWQRISRHSAFSGLKKLMLCCKVFVNVEIEGNWNGMIMVGLEHLVLRVEMGVSCGGGSGLWAIEFIYVRWPQAVPAHTHLITFTLRLDILQTNRDGGKIIRGKFTWTVVEHIWSGGKTLPENPLFRCDHIVNQGWP